MMTVEQTRDLRSAAILAGSPTLEELSVRLAGIPEVSGALPGQARPRHEVFFTADLHFCHKKMSETRGYGSMEAMHEAMIADWNARVRPDDEVYVLGDVSFAGGRRTVELLEELRGRLHLVRGNHDKGMNKSTEAYFLTVSDLKTVKVVDGADVQRIVCCHFPMLSWDMAHYGAWHLHGHSHGSAKYPYPDAKILDVGVDAINPLTGLRFGRPVSYSEVKSIMTKRKTKVADYHQEQVEE